MSASPKYDCLCAGIVVADFIRAGDHVPMPAACDERTRSRRSAAEPRTCDGPGQNRAPLGSGWPDGSDMPGRFVRDELAAGGVDTTYLAKLPQRKPAPPW